MTATVIPFAKKPTHGFIRFTLDERCAILALQDIAGIDVAFSQSAEGRDLVAIMPDHRQGSFIGRVQITKWREGFRLHEDPETVSTFPNIAQAVTAALKAVTPRIAA